ncbi:MAG: RluA family pseudouridine synthase, partial [Acidimicrobiia bacterium]|nr:RluA family pseudouridine synthase [Acidimicrobiia bacterium]
MSERVGRGEPERRGRPLMEHVPAALAGERVDRVVALLADVSRSVAVAVIADGGVRVDGAVATSGKVRLAEGALVEIDGAAIPVDAPPQADAEVGFTVVHEDDDVIVVDKPAGLVVHPGPGRREGTLVNGLLHRYPELARVGDDPARPGIVHRLDAGSSGLLVVARTAAAAASLVGQFSAHTAGRRYDAVVWGVPD